MKIDRKDPFFWMDVRIAISGILACLCLGVAIRELIGKIFGV